MHTRQRAQIHAPMGRVLAEILAFERYPDFIPAVRSARVLAREPSAWEVAFSLHIVRRIDYTLRILQEPVTEDGSVRVSWSLVEGALLACEGAWELRPLEQGQLTEVTWSLDVQVKAFVPRVLSNTLERRAAPELLEALKKRVEGTPAVSPSAPAPLESAPADG